MDRRHHHRSAHRGNDPVGSHVSKLTSSTLEQGGDLLLYLTEDGSTRNQCRFEADTIGPTQVQLAELFQTSAPNINLHLGAIYEEAELDEAATIESYLIVRSEGARQVARQVLHCSLPTILAIGYRVRSQRGTQFRQWATARLDTAPHRCAGIPFFLPPALSCVGR